MGPQPGGVPWTVVEDGRKPLPADLSARGLGPRDAPALAGLMARCDDTYREWAPAGWEPPPGQPELAGLAERLRDPQRWACGAFDAGGRMVGAVMWEGFEQPPGAESPLKVAHVGAVFVDPARWRQGIATVLLDRAEEAMSERGHQLARLWTPEGAPARHFYERHGWRHDGRRMWHHRLRLPHVGYQKQLVPSRATAPQPRDRAGAGYRSSPRDRTER